jgi:hypothetical protein
MKSANAMKEILMLDHDIRTQNGASDDTPRETAGTAPTRERRRQRRGLGWLLRLLCRRSSVFCRRMDKMGQEFPHLLMSFCGIIENTAAKL